MTRSAYGPLGFLILLATISLRVPAVAAQLAEFTTVKTISGTGAAGFADGRHGSFLRPAGIAYDAQGRLYVVDTAAQRIRRIDAGGAIYTLAGGGNKAEGGWWVAGAYRDGTATQARFNEPQGIAIRRDGWLYIADSLNHCIRKVSPDGTVQTYAGTPTEAAQVDGTQAVARFVRPTGMAVDGEDNLYVADYAAIRKIDPTGTVSTIANFGHEPYAVAVVDGPRGVTIFAGDKYGIVARPAGAVDSKDDRRFVSAHAPEGMTSLDTNGDRPLGNPAYLTALDENTVAFTDVRTNTVRLLELVSGEVKIIAGTPAEDGSGNTGGYRNGPGWQAQFLAPTGIASASDGGLTVADGGNRRIRHLSRFYRVDPWGWLGQAYPGIEAHPNPSDYRIAYIGNSYIWYDTDWSTSIEGLIQSKLASQAYWRGAKRAPRVIPIIKYSLAQVASFLESAAQTGLYRMVVFDLNWGTIDSSFAGAGLFEGAAGPWQAQLSDTLAAINRNLAAKNIALLVVTHPTAFEVSPSEATWLVFSYEPKPNEDLASETARRAHIGTLINAAVKRSGVPRLDLTAPILTAENATVRRPLFGAGDYHFTQYGRRLVANAIAARLEQLAPWRNVRP